MKSQNKFTVISTFSGCGGSSLGYQLAGGKVLLAVEMDDNAVETYRLNFPETQIYHGDIHDLTVEKIFELTGLKEGELDILDGSPPCQGFSTAGKREFCDPRNQLYNEYIRLLRGLKPKVFIMENVSGLVKGKMKLIFADILKELKQSGYKVKVRLMNAKYYNVPQSRQRLIFIGVRNDLEVGPSHPKPESKPITLKECIWDLRNKEVENKELPPIVKEIAKYQPKIWSSNPKIYKKIKGNLAGSLSLKWGNWDEVSQTLIKSEISLTGVVHPDRQRYMNCNEYKRIASYPDNFKFIDRKSCIERIGNSVPPNFMKAIASHVYKEILS